TTLTNKQSKMIKVNKHQGTLVQKIKDQLNDLNIKHLAFEKEHVTYATYEVYKDALDVELVPTQGIVEELRLIKTEHELNIMKKAAQIADQAFEHILSYIKPGVKE